MRMSLALELRGVGKRFVVGTAACRGSVDALRSVDLEIEAGEAIAIVGAVGTGKSTLLLCAAALLRPDAGDIAWFGQSDRATGSERATYYFPGGSGRSRSATSSRAPHIHLVDGLESLSLTTVSRVEQWIERRTGAGDAVLVAARDAHVARDLVERIVVLRAGRLFADERGVVAARVAEPIEWGPR
ncbi:MAG TPA: ABC transporter ATP-binding protein [Gemmatimonadaceae bacterium]